MTATRFLSSTASSLALAAGLVLATPAPALRAVAPQADRLRVDLSGASAGSVLAIAINGGKVADAPITSGGIGSSILDIGNLGKVQAQVYVKVCKDGRTEVLLYTDGGTPPKDNECEDRMVGAFWLGKSRRITINVRTFAFSAVGTGVMGVGKRTLGIGAAAVAGTAVAVAANGSSGSTP